MNKRPSTAGEMLGHSTVIAYPGTLGLDLPFIDTQNLSGSEIFTNSPRNNHWWVPAWCGKDQGLWQLFFSDRPLLWETEDREVRAHGTGRFPGSALQQPQARLLSVSLQSGGK